MIQRASLESKRSLASRSSQFGKTHTNEIKHDIHPEYNRCIDIDNIKKDGGGIFDYKSDLTIDKT